MKRRLLQSVAVLSLLPFLAVAGIWVRSYVRADFYYRGKADGSQVYFDSGRGFLSVTRASGNPKFTHVGTTWKSRPDPPYPMWGPPSTFAERLGFWSITGWTSSGPLRRWIVPYWFLLLLTSVPSALWLAVHLRQRRRRQRRAAGRCLQCGYDLRATPDRCPECGHAPGMR
jgi:hypothetical protein